MAHSGLGLPPLAIELNKIK